MLAFIESIDDLQKTVVGSTHGHFGLLTAPGVIEKAVVTPRLGMDRLKGHVQNIF